jgi:S-DNA-T family DNA segregation ATPase FtsK/SpoIIIE
MANSFAIKTSMQPRELGGVYTPRRRFVPAQRDPWRLPEDKLELPPPGPMPGAPPQLNLLTTIIPPVFMIGASLLIMLFSKQAGSGTLLLLLPTVAMGLGMPFASLIGLLVQKNTYKKNMSAREAAYRQRLNTEWLRIRPMIEAQRDTLNRVYPGVPELLAAVRQQGSLLWARRPSDDDFLSARIGTQAGKPSFAVEPPRSSDPHDPLPALCNYILKEVQAIPGLPALLPLGEIGSLAITGKGSSSSIHALARRMVLDLVVHHSPQDVQVMVLSDTREGAVRWDWLKWAPHTGALDGESGVRRLAFDAVAIDRALEFIVQEYNHRKGRGDGVAPGGAKGRPASLVVLIDDSGQVRQSQELPLLAQWGHENGIHLVFVGGRDWPRECRGRVETLDDRHFRVVETWTRENAAREGDFEIVSAGDCETAARAMAALEVAGSQASIPLPQSIRLSQVLGPENLALDAIRQAWSAEFAPQDLLQFPIGVRARRDRLEQATINLLPADKGGNDAYHTILIGTTGSGKSEFMKSLVMGAALRYPPDQLNFFFMDFKGGAAFSAFEELPHVSGIVTNLDPALVERGLDSVGNEIDRRQKEFAGARVQNIWDYNARPGSPPLPHLVLFLDEFARGLADFPRLRSTLDVLVRQGRSLGMYLILANQDVNSAVDQLLNNVGWSIALKVAKQDELHAITKERSLANATRAGQGYLCLVANREITEFQSGYAGLPVQAATADVTEEFTIFQVEPDGSLRSFHRSAGQAGRPKPEAKVQAQKEENLIISLLRQASEDLHIRPAPRIYLEPMPVEIPLEDVLADSGLPRRFDGQAWTAGERNPLIAPLGALDLQQECRQEMLLFNLDDQDGHLWVVGSAGSGRESSLSALLMSLALTHTPAEARFYILELGSGELNQFESLPHTGAVIRPQAGAHEKERLERLVTFLDAEMDRRTAGQVSAEEAPDHTAPALVLVINNFADLRANFPDEADHLNRLVRDGKSAGIHLVAATNRGAELIRSVSNNIARRLVLQVSAKDEYLDILGRNLGAPAVKAEGRGYWMDGRPLECQIARPPKNMRDLMRAMRAAWTGPLPTPIETLPACIPLSTMVAKVASPALPAAAPLPVGQSYDSLEWIVTDLADSGPFWLVLGPKESGKSNFLACAARGLSELAGADWNMRVYALRRGPLTRFTGVNWEVFSTPEAISADCRQLIEKVKSGQPVADGRRLLLLVDDLGAAFQPGREALAKDLNELSQCVECLTDVSILASGLLEELRMQLVSPFLKLLRQGRTGMVFSKDSNELDWLGAAQAVTLAQRRLGLPVGRGFYVSKGKPLMVQTPRWEDCPEPKGR